MLFSEIEEASLGAIVVLVPRERIIPGSNNAAKIAIAAMAPAIATSGLRRCANHPVGSRRSFLSFSGTAGLPASSV